MLTIRAAPLVDEPGREDAHEAGERDGADSCSSSASLSTRSNSSLSTPLLSHAQVGSPASRAHSRPAASGLFEATSDDLIAVRLARPARACCCRDPKSGSQHGWDHALWVADQSSVEFQVPALPRNRAAARPGFDAADLEDFFAGASSARQLRGSALADDDGHADAAIEGPRHFLGSDLAALLEQREDRRAIATPIASTIAWQPSGRTRGIFSRSPPPVMCARPLIRRCWTSGSSERT